MHSVDNFNRYLSKILPSWAPFDFTNKVRNLSTHVSYMLNRTQRIFKWSGLPDTIPQRNLELYLQINGNACFYEYNGNLYVFVGGRGGEPDVYYMPTIYTIANPALALSVNARINVDCIVMPNDSAYMGLIPIFCKYGSLMVENELSMSMNIIQSRILSLISADDDRTYESAKVFINDIVNGKISAIQDSQFFDGLKTSPYSANGVHSLTDLIEMEQYLKASLFNELGINANYNMKRESINSNESQLNTDALHPLIDDMMECRKTFAEKVNAMFNTSISVEFDSTWKTNEQEETAELINLMGGENDANIEISTNNNESDDCNI